MQGKKRKDKFRQDTIDIAKPEAIQRENACERRIENTKKKKSRHAKAVQAVCDARINEEQEQFKADDCTLTSATSSVASSSSRKRSSSSSKKRTSRKKSLPKVSERNMLDQYLTPSSKSTRSVPSTVSTVASSQMSMSASSSQMTSSQMTDNFSPTADQSNLASVKKKLPVVDPVAAM